MPSAAASVGTSIQAALPVVPEKRSPIENAIAESLPTDGDDVGENPLRDGGAMANSRVLSSRVTSLNMKNSRLISKRTLPDSLPISKTASKPASETVKLCVYVQPKNKQTICESFTYRAFEQHISAP